MRRLAIGCLIAVCLAGGWAFHAYAARSELKRLPNTVLWAWQRPEKLGYIDGRRSAVAVLAETIDLTGSGIRVEPRLDPLVVPADALHIAVLRIQSAPNSDTSELARKQIAWEVTKIAEYAHPTAIQIDFDATVSQRKFYRELLSDLRSRLPKDMPLSMTALVSWCEGDDWIADLPVDEAVPMYFRMGVDASNIRRDHMYLRALHEPLCRSSVGVSLDEPWPHFDPGVRVYAFDPSPWTENNYRHLLERLAQ